MENAFEGCKAGEGDQEEDIEATHMGLEGAQTRKMAIDKKRAGNFERGFGGRAERTRRGPDAHGMYIIRTNQTM